MAIFGAMFSYCLTPVKEITSLKIGSSHFRVTSTDSKSLNHLEQYDKQHYKKVLLSSFHLDGHTLGFLLQTQKLEPHCAA